MMQNEGRGDTVSLPASADRGLTFGDSKGGLTPQDADGKAQVAWVNQVAWWEMNQMVSFPETRMVALQPIRLDLLTGVVRQWCVLRGRLKGASVRGRRQTCALSSPSGGAVSVLLGGVVGPWVRLPAFRSDGGVRRPGGSR